MVGSNTRVYAQDPPPIDILVQENVGVSDSNDTAPPAQVNVDETVSVVDDATVTGPVAIVVAEQITVSDTGGLLNSAPIVDAGLSLTIDEGSPAALAATIIVLDPQLTTATIDWGDGTSDQIVPTTAGEISATHLYLDDGVYEVLVTVAGLFGDQGSDTTQIEVVNVAPEADAGGPYGGNTDEAIVLTAIGNDPGGDPVAYAWDLDDDGEFDDGNVQSVLFSSSTPGIFPISVEVQDDSGESAQAISQVVVSVVQAADDADPGSPSETPAITSPVTGSTLSAQETFEWTPNDSDVVAWYLRIGTSPGADDIYRGSALLPTILSATTLISGTTIYVSLSYLEPTIGWTEITETYTGPGDSPTLDGIPPSNPSLLLSSRNITADRPFQQGDGIVLRATIQPGPGQFTIPVDALDFTLNGLPLPSPAFAIALPNGSYQAFLGVNVATAGETLEFGAIAYDAARNVIATAALIINVVDSPPPLQMSLFGPTSVSEDSEGRYEVIGYNTTGQPVQYSFRQDGLLISAGSSTVVLNPDRRPILPIPGFELTVVAVDWLGRTSTAVLNVEVSSRSTGDDGETPAEREDSEEATPDGRVSGRAVIGRLVQMSRSLIIVNAKVGQDLTDVQVHIDPAATQISEKLDAESYTRGSRVVVIADGDVTSGNAVALKIAPIPGTATRKHDRLIVSKPRDGDAADLVGSEDGRGSSVVKDSDGTLGDGDQVVVLVRRSDSNKRNEKPKIIDNDEVKDRLETFARTKFDDGDTDSTGLIDKLAGERREREQERIDEAKKHADEAVRRAARLAEEKAKRAAEKDATDPVKAIRRRAVADSEEEIIRCASRVVGREVTGEGDLSDAEKLRVRSACLSGEDERDGDIPDRPDDERGGSAPPEVIECIVKVFGSVPNRPLTDAEEARLISACSLGDEEENDREAREKEREERNSPDAVDARKRAYCAANPSDQNCSGNPDGSSGDKRDGSGSEAEKRAYCTANPDDSRCSGGSGDKGVDSEAEKRAFCAANPSDSRCAADDGDDNGDDRTKDKSQVKDESGDTGTKDGSGTKPPGK